MTILSMGGFGADSGENFTEFLKFCESGQKVQGGSKGCEECMEFHRNSIHSYEFE